MSKRWMSPFQLSQRLCPEDYVLNLSSSTHYTDVVAITYKAASANQKLTLSYVKSQTIGIASGSVDLIAAWLK